MMVRSISSPALFRTALIGLALAFMAMTTSDRLVASEGELPVKRDYSAVVAGPAPEEQSKDDAAAKSAVLRLVESFADELKPEGIRVNAVLPSIIDTPENRAAMPAADPSAWVTPVEKSPAR